MGEGYRLPDVPHHSKYKWQDIPELVEHQKRLAERGLRDPWARNHVWKFICAETKNGKLPWYMYWTMNHPVARGFTLGMLTLGTYISIDMISRGEFNKTIWKGLDKIIK